MEARPFDLKFDWQDTTWLQVSGLRQEESRPTRLLRLLRPDANLAPRSDGLRRILESFAVVLCAKVFLLTEASARTILCRHCSLLVGAPGSSRGNLHGGDPMGKPEPPETTKRSLNRRVTQPLLQETDQRLRAYALAAGAAGVSVLALAQPARAEVIYTATHITLTNGHLIFDPTNQGASTFILKDTTESHSGYAYTRELEIDGSSNACVIGGDKQGVAVSGGPGPP